MATITPISNMACLAISSVERANARLKDEFGGRMVRVRGQTKVACHLMFGVMDWYKPILEDRIDFLSLRSSFYRALIVSEDYEALTTLTEKEKF